MGDEERLRRRTVFDADPQRYAAARPSYPPALFDRLAQVGALGPGARVLEIAPGTGQATRALADRGWAVTAVELAPGLAAEARRRLADRPNAEVIVSPFESWPLPAEPFDAVVCATAFHWLDPVNRVDRIADALRPGGVAAIVSSHHVTGGTDAYWAASQACYLRHVPGTEPDFSLPEETALPSHAAEFEACGRFVDVRQEVFPVELTYDTASFLALLATYSQFIQLPAADRAAALECLGTLLDRDFGGRLVMRMAFALLLARRR